jgi:hypothetical protein
MREIERVQAMNRPAKGRRTGRLDGVMFPIVDGFEVLRQLRRRRNRARGA